MAVATTIVDVEVIQRAIDYISGSVPPSPKKQTDLTSGEVTTLEPGQVVVDAAVTAELETLKADYAALQAKYDESQARIADLEQQLSALRGTHQLNERKNKLEMLNQEKQERMLKHRQESARQKLEGLFLYSAWEALLVFLNYEDVVILMCSSKWLAEHLCSSHKVWAYVIQSISTEKYHLRDLLQRRGSRVESIGKVAIRKLMEKFVSSGYRIGFDFEGVLYKTSKSLDTLAAKFGPAFQETIATSDQPAIQSITEQIAERYDILKCNELLTRSTSLYATNKKINEWILFLCKTLAQLLYHGALLLQESRELEQVKDRIARQIDKHRENNAKLKLDHSNANQAVDAEKQLNEWLIKRVHELETISNSQITEIVHFRTLSEQAENETLQVKTQLDKTVDEMESAKAILYKEIDFLRKRSDGVAQQKEALENVFLDFKSMFDSLQLELGN